MDRKFKDTSKYLFKIDYSNWSKHEEFPGERRDTLYLYSDDQSLSNIEKKIESLPYYEDVLIWSIENMGLVYPDEDITL